MIGNLWDVRFDDLVKSGVRCVGTGLVRVVIIEKLHQTRTVSGLEEFS